MMILSESVTFDIIIIRYGELALKAPYTRRIFEQRLLKNISSACTQADIVCSLDRQWGRIYVSTSNMTEAVRSFQNIFGISSFSPAMKTNADIDSISEQALMLMKSLIGHQKSFAVRVQRSGEHRFTSLDVARDIGQRINDAFPLRVDLTDPDIELSIEIRDNHAYVFTDKFRGPGGMPQGTQGKILGLIDSSRDLVACWYLLKRGCSIVFYIREEGMLERTKAFLEQWFTPSKLIGLDTNHESLKKINQVITSHHCSALVQGLSFSNGGTQILEKIETISKAIDVPLLLPLIAFSADDIERKSEQIGLPL